MARAKRLKLAPSNERQYKRVEASLERAGWPMLCAVRVRSQVRSDAQVKSGSGCARAQLAQDSPRLVLDLSEDKAGH